MAKKNDITNVTRFYNELDFWQQPKTLTYKTFAEKMDFAKQKSQTNQNADFGKPDFDRKATKPTKPR
jgi:hypothetical protein